MPAQIRAFGWTTWILVLGVSRDRVRQIDERAMERLRRRRGETGQPKAAA